MRQYKVVRYSNDHKLTWNKFIESSKNGTFLFKRGFMDYHKHLFEDYSLMVYDKDKLVCCFPLNRNKDEVISHQGLTYGGTITQPELKLSEYIKVFSSILEFLQINQIKTLMYKVIPTFYTTHPSEEENYVFFLLNAHNYRTDTTLTINNNTAKIPYQKRRIRSIKKASKLDLSFKNDKNFKLFWDKVLTPNLLSKYDKKPVHSLEEIERLSSVFPENIHQVNVFYEGEIVAGCTIFETKTTAHAQYISGTELGNSLGIIDKLFDELITTFFSHKAFFNFGICNEQSGKYINHGLLDWKEGFGARTYSHKFYKIKTENYNNLVEVLK